MKTGKASACFKNNVRCFLLSFFVLVLQRFLSLSLARSSRVVVFCLSAFFFLLSRLLFAFRLVSLAGLLSTLFPTVKKVHVLFTRFLFSYSLSCSLPLSSFLQASAAAGLDGLEISPADAGGSVGGGEKAGPALPKDPESPESEETKP